MEDIDPELTNNLMWILDNEIENLGINYSVNRFNFGILETVDLIPNGKNI